MSKEAERKIKRGKVGKGRFEVEMRFLSFLFLLGVVTLGVDGRPRGQRR